MGLALVFLFVRSGKNFRLTCTVFLDTSSTAGSPVIVRCTGTDRKIQQSLDCRRSQNKQKGLNRWTNRPRWTTWSGRTSELQENKGLFFCCLTERQNFLAVALFRSLTWEILPLSCIIFLEIMPLAAKFSCCKIPCTCDTGNNPYKNSHEYSWESHEILMRKWKLSTILMRISWAFHQISWESHEIFIFTWKLERFLMRFSSFHELLMRFLLSFSWDSRDFFHVKIGTLSHENLMRMSRDSHEHIWAFSHENPEFGDWCLHWILMRFSWDSHEAEIFSRDSHESAVVSWASHEILTRFSRDSHEILTRFLWDSHEIQVYRYNEHKPNPSFLFFNFFFVRLATFCEVTLAAKKINNIFCIYIYKNLLKSDSHSLIQTLPLLVAHNTSLVKLKLHHSPQTVKFDLRLASVMYTEKKKEEHWVC